MRVACYRFGIRLGAVILSSLRSSATGSMATTLRRAAARLASYTGRQVTEISLFSIPCGGFSKRCYWGAERTARAL